MTIHVCIYCKTGFNCECLIIANSALLVYTHMRKPYANAIIKNTMRVKMLERNYFANNTGPTLVRLWDGALTTIRILYMYIMHIVVMGVGGHAVGCGRHRITMDWPGVL